MITNLRLQCFCIIYVIVIKTEWVPFCIKYFQINFLACKWLYMYLDNSSSKEKISVHGKNITIHLMLFKYHWVFSLQWRHNERDGVSNHERLDCLLNYLFRCRSKKTSKLRVTGLCEGNSPVNSPLNGPVTWKMFPFDDVIMYIVTCYFCTRK